MIKLDIATFWKNILRISIVPVIMTVIGVTSFQIISIKNLWMLLAFGIIYAVLFAAGSWLIEMNAYEKSLITGMMKRMIN